VIAIAGVGVTLAVARSVRSGPRRVTAAAAVGVALSGLLASFSGFLLPWDQLALWSVTVGTNMRGEMPLLRHSSQVQYILIGGATVSVTTFRLWFYVHVLLVPVALIGLGLLAARRLGRRADKPDGPTGLGS